MTNHNQSNTILTRGVDAVLPDQQGLAKLMDERKIKVYLGIDPTGSLLTLGHAVVLRKLQQFAEAGHETILLIGNGTVRIGDPTGKDTTRPVLTDEVIQENFKNWKAQAQKVLDFSKITIMRNGDWLDKLTYADIVKLLAKTTVQQLMERDMFQERLTKNLPIHGHEIIYPLLQGYDSVAMNVDLELGGSDQLFNMMMGRTLVREYQNREKWVLTTPIINGTDGRKMSKSYNNFVALTENPRDMYGKLMRISDGEIITYLELLTNIPDEEIADIEQAIENGENPMRAKKLVAESITTWLHDAPSAAEAAHFFEQTVQQKQTPADIQTVVVTSPLTLLEICKLCKPDKSNGELKRLITQGAVELIEQSEVITDPQRSVEITQPSVIRIGKRNFYRLQRHE